MQREIKFRAWNRLSQSMFNVAQIDFVTSGEHWIHDEWDTMSGFDEYDLMQYTGLKDKNGVEIYEGDILNEIGVVDDDKNIQNFIVYFTNGAFGDGYESFSEINGEYQVLGNVYENPDLNPNLIKK